MGQIYAVFFTDGLLKVGRGRSADNRISAHRSAAKIRGAKVRESHFVNINYGLKDAERELIKFAESISREKISSEWFSGIEGSIESSGIKKVMEFLSEKYGDNKGMEAEIAEIEARSERIVSAIVAPKNNYVEDLDWLFSWKTSLVIDSLYKGWGFHGLAFEDFNGKPSIFKISCALYLYKRIDQFDKVFTDVFFNEYEAFNSIMTEPLEVDGEFYGLWRAAQ